MVDMTGNSKCLVTMASAACGRGSIFVKTSAMISVGCLLIVQPLSHDYQCLSDINTSDSDSHTTHMRQHSIINNTAGQTKGQRN